MAFFVDGAWDENRVKVYDMAEKVQRDALAALCTLSAPVGCTPAPGAVVAAFAHLRGETCGGSVADPLRAGMLSRKRLAVGLCPAREYIPRSEVDNMHATSSSSSATPATPIRGALVLASGASSSLAATADAGGPDKDGEDDDVGRDFGPAGGALGWRALWSASIENEKQLGSGSGGMRRRLQRAIPGQSRRAARMAAEATRDPVRFLQRPLADRVREYHWTMARQGHAAILWLACGLPSPEPSHGHLVVFARRVLEPLVHVDRAPERLLLAHRQVTVLRMALEALAGERDKPGGLPLLAPAHFAAQEALALVSAADAGTMMGDSDHVGGGPEPAGQMRTALVVAPPVSSDMQQRGVDAILLAGFTWPAMRRAGMAPPRSRFADRQLAALPLTFFVLPPADALFRLAAHTTAVLATVSGGVHNGKLLFTGDEILRACFWNLVFEHTFQCTPSGVATFNHKDSNATTMMTMTTTTTTRPTMAMNGLGEAASVLRALGSTAAGLKLLGPCETYLAMAMMPLETADDFSACGITETSMKALAEPREYADAVFSTHAALWESDARQQLTRRPSVTLHS